MKPETSAKLHKACADLAKEITPYLTGFAPYTPVTVSQHTVPHRESDRQAYERRLRELSEPPYGTNVTISQEPLNYWKSPSK
ncbi:MAG: hypothetical protein RIG26_14875 [Thalassospira sp.]|uniref:hypothetical protein n=1 Tax=Thalassospira sp. TaxID=1912094 RepID=UPI0032ED42B8